MITAQDVLEALEKNLMRIHGELGPDWPMFYRELAPLRAGFTGVTDRNALEVAADPVWQLCRRYPFVKNLIHGRTTQRKLPAGGMNQEEERPVREIVNRYQSLFDRLEEIELSDRRNENTGLTRDEGHR